MLGDNIFYGSGLGHQLTRFSDLDGAAVFGYRVANPTEYGVVEFDDSFKAVSLEEKPSDPKSDYAVPGLYFYSNDVVGYAGELKPSARGELEITDLNRLYLERVGCSSRSCPRGTAWLDTGTFDSLNDAFQLRAHHRGSPRAPRSAPRGGRLAAGVPLRRRARRGRPAPPEVRLRHLPDGGLLHHH